jgi:hypothetical protein
LILKSDQFPPYLYRAFNERNHAIDFAFRGKFRLGLLDEYKQHEDSARRDETEGESRYFFKTGTVRVDAGGSFLSPVYLLCTAGPEVDLEYFKKKFGQYLVKINDPRKLLEDLNAAKPVNSTMELIGEAELEKVRYTKDEEDSIDPDSDDAVILDYIQKPPSEADDEEYRFVVFAGKPLEGDPDEYLYYDLDQRLQYIEVLNSNHVFENTLQKNIKRCRKREEKMPHIFISYPDEEEEIVGNLRDRFRVHGIEAWVYSYDKTPVRETWEEIEEKIIQSKVIIFVASEDTVAAEGQHRELNLVLNLKESGSIFPIVTGDLKFSDLPEKIRHINGERLTGNNVKTIAQSIARVFFPQLFLDTMSPKWEYPRPGEWLEISKLDTVIEEYADIGDKVYFRRISPMGLFECYFPRIKSLFWFYPDNLKRTEIIDDDGKMEDEKVPLQYRNITSYECERKGYGILYGDKNNK